MSNPLSAYPLSKIDGLGAQALAKLKAQGIRTTAALLDNASTPKGRKALAARTGLSEQQLLEVMDGVSQVTGNHSALNDGIDLISFLAETGVSASKGEAKKLVQNGGVSLNKEKIMALDHKITMDHLLNDKYLLIQKGKKDYTLAIFG